MKIRKKLLAGVLCISMIMQNGLPAAVVAAPAGTETAEETNEMVLADFNFDTTNENGGFDGKNATASIVGSNVSLEEHAKNGSAVRLGDKSYLDVRASDGSSLLTGWDCVTVSFDVKLTEKLSWILYAAPDAAAPAYPKEKYLGFVREGGKSDLVVQRYLNTNGRPGSAQCAVTNDVWNHVEAVITEKETVLQINDGAPVTCASSYLLSDILKDASILQVGKANWGEGEYSDMALDNLKITGSIGESVKADESLSVMEGKRKSLHVTGISRYADPVITYTSADESIAAVDPAGVVTGKKAGTTSVTVKVARGTAVKTMQTSVTVKPREEMRTISSLDFDADSIGDAVALCKGLTEYTGDISYEEGRSGRAVRLDGYGLKLNKANVGENYTVSLWMKQDGILSENQQILFLGQGNNDRENWLAFAGDRGTAETYEIWTRNTTETSAISGWNYLDEDAGQIAGQWAMVTVTGNGTDFCAYLNGEPLELNGIGKTYDTIRNAANILNGEEQDIYVGVNFWNSTFSGLIDDVVVYDQDLTAAEVKTLYEQQYLECVAEHLSLGDLTAVSEDLTLPDGEGGVTVTWSSDREDVLAADGTVARQEQDTKVTLTAHFSYGSASLEKNYEVTVVHADASGDLQEASDALGLCSVTDRDLNLPSEGKKGTAITWKSSDPEALADDGKVVSRPKAGEGNVKVTLTATVSKGEESVTKSFEVEVLEEYYGYIYGYITGDNDRTGSLHLAYSTDGRSYTALNANTGIHFAKIGTGEGAKDLSTGIRFAAVSLFRKADGSFGLAAPQGKDQKKVYLYDSKDLVTYGKERLLAANSSVGNVTDVTVRYDAAVNGYDLCWTGGGKQYANATADLTVLEEARETSYDVPGSEAETVPEGAKKGSVIGVTKAEYEKIIDHFAKVAYRETESVEDVTVSTAADVKAALPDTVSVSYDDGSSSAMHVAWDTDTPDLEKAGTYTVTGTVSSYENPLIEERADPQILYDEQAKCYYFTSSYPAYGDVNSGYDRLILRKADSISGLAEAEEITIWTAPESGKMAKHVWAPELHQIDGRWYVFFAAGNSDNIWAIRPYVLVCQGEDPYKAENWVKADGTAEIHAATSEESGYFDNMSLDMTCFADEDADGVLHYYVIWAELSPSSLYMQEIDPAAPWTGKGKVILLTEPEFGWERDSELVNEGPAILKHDGKIFCTFSASGTGPEYCIGLLYAEETSDLMDPASWTKLSYPVLTSDDVPGEYGPGHNSFTVDAAGNPVFVYHARSEECYQDQCAYAGRDPLYDPCRHARVKNVHWSKEGLPILNTRAEEELPEAARTITVQVTVQQDSQVKRDLSEAVISGVKDVVETGEQICPAVTVTWGTASLEAGRDYTVAYGENKSGKGTVTVTAAEGSRYTGSRTVEFRILPAVIADLDFDDLTDGLRGGNAVAAVAGGSIELTEHGEGKAAVFTAGDKDYLTVTAKDGSSLLTGYDEITVSYDILPLASGTNWVYYASDDDTMLSWNTHGNREKYLGVLVKNGNLEVERYHNSGSRPSNPKVAVDASKWQHVDIVYAKDCTVVYLDGKRVSRVESSYALKDILGTDSFFQIGKANWAPGEYASMQLDNFKILAGTRLYEEDKIDQTAAEIEEALGDLSHVTENLTLLTRSSDGLEVSWSSDKPEVIAADGTVTIPELENVEVTLTAVITNGASQVTKTYQATVLAAGNAVDKIAAQLSLPYSTEKGKEVYGNITLPDTVNGTGTVTWATDHPEIVNVKEIPGKDGYDPTPAGKVTRPAEDTKVTLTAVITLNQKSVEKVFAVTVKAAPKKLTEDDLTDYFFAYFTGEGYADGEQIYFSASHDGLNWKELNDNQPTLTSTLGEKGVRDPFIIRSPEGDKFYLIATDLKINGGNGWTAAQEAGSQALMVWESTDLVNWSEQRMVTVSAAIGAGCTWAPEATYDERTGEYVVYWASKVAGDGYAKQRLYYAKTRDFYSFTEPKVYIEKDQSSIDTTMIEHNGTYYRYTKNEGGATNEMGALTKTIFIEKSSDVLGTFTQIPSDTLNSRENQYVEGPTIFKLNKDDADTDTWCLLVDDFGGGGYYPLLTTDLESGKFTRLTKGYQLPGGTRFPRHGTPLRITAEEFAAVAKAYRMDTISVEEMIQAIDSLTVSSENMAELKELADTYQTLSEEEKAQVTEARYARLQEALALAEHMRKQGVVVKDQSTNGRDFDFASQENAVYVDSEAEGRYMKGYGDVTELNSLVGGTQPFTVEMEINPNDYGYGGSDYNLLFSKGDNCAALRVSEQKVYFHIKDSENWKSATVPLTSGQMKSWIHVAAVYDGSRITAYADGKTVSTSVGAILNSSYPFGIGYCQETKRYGRAGIRSIRVYKKALTAAELDEGSIPASDDCVQLWYDFTENSYGVNPSKVQIGQEAAALNVKETAQLTASVSPYYASEELVWSSENEKIASVTADGLVKGIAEGSTMIRAAAAKEPKVYAEIPVTVTDPDRADAEEMQKLQKEISDTESRVQGASSYTDESWEAYTQALTAAKEILKKEYVTLKEVQTAIEDLKKAFEGLTEKETEPETESETETETETESETESESESESETQTESEPVTEPESETSSNPESETGGGTVVQPEKLSAPVLKADPADYRTIRLSWTRSEGALQYAVYRRKAGTKENYQALATVGGTQLTYSDKKAVLGTRYEYAVEAIGKTTRSSLSKTVICRAVPAAVKVKAKALRGGVKLTWKKVRTAKKKYAKSYRIYRKTTKGKWKKIAVVSGKKKTYLDKKAKKGIRYSYRVVAVAKKGKKNIAGAYSAKNVKVKAK